MKVSVKLFAALARGVSRSGQIQLPEGFRAGTPMEIQLPHGSTLADLVDYLGLPREQVKVTFVNGRAQGLDHPLEPGDEVGIFPPIGGG
jgi:molybdopterin synthase sulfur carrier subunit